MAVKYNNNTLNLIAGCLYVNSFGLHVSVNFMTIIRSVRAKIYDMQQSLLHALVYEELHALYVKTYTRCIRRLTRTVYEDLCALYRETYTRCM